MSQNLTLKFKDNDLLPLLFGEHNLHLGYLEEKLGIRIVDRGNTLTLSGEGDLLDTAEKILMDLWAKIEQKHDIGIADIDAELRFLKAGKKASKKAKQDITLKTKRKSITARSPMQAHYMETALKNEMIFGMGPAGTGKTYIAVAVAVSMLLEGKVERLIFCRPAVEAGERLGFLPGDLKEKVDPYLRPIYDALHDMMPTKDIEGKIASGEIEIAPLAYMRGRTLSNAFVIVDEAQNTTCTQMKMLLTRLGENSRMIINGDLSQTDLPVGVKSGLRDVHEILEGEKGIAFVHFTKDDVIRHKLVSRIVNAYERQKKHRSET